MFRKSIDPNRPIKIALLGDGSTGKTSLFQKLTQYDSPNYRFSKRYKATENFQIKLLDLQTNVGTLKIYLWDTAGQEKYEGADLRDGYIMGSDAVLVLYDVINKKTIANVPKWLHDISSTCNNIPVAVVGNKMDKIPNVNSIDTVKLRDKRLRSIYGHYDIHNFIISIKENTIINESNYFSNSILQDGVLKPLEYVLSKHFGRDVKIKFNNNVSYNDDF